MSESKETSRKDAASKIIAEPGKYKVCESCGSIVVLKSSTCPNCNAYRFDVSVEHVRAQAELLADRDPLSIDKKDYA